MVCVPRQLSRIPPLIGNNNIVEARIVPPGFCDGTHGVSSFGKLRGRKSTGIAESEATHKTHKHTRFMRPSALDIWNDTGCYLQIL